MKHNHSNQMNCETLASNVQAAMEQIVEDNLFDDIESIFDDEEIWMDIIGAHVWIYARYTLIDKICQGDARVCLTGNLAQSPNVAFKKLQETFNEVWNVECGNYTLNIANDSPWNLTMSQSQFLKKERKHMAIELLQTPNFWKGAKKSLNACQLLADLVQRALDEEPVEEYATPNPLARAVEEQDFETMRRWRQFQENNLRSKGMKKILRAFYALKAINELSKRDLVRTITNVYHNIGPDIGSVARWSLDAQRKIDEFHGRVSDYLKNITTATFPEREEFRHLSITDYWQLAMALDPKLLLEKFTSENRFDFTDSFKDIFSHCIGEDPKNEEVWLNLQVEREVCGGGQATQNCTQMCKIISYMKSFVVDKDQRKYMNLMSNSVHVQRRSLVTKRANPRGTFKPALVPYCKWGLSFTGIEMDAIEPGFNNPKLCQNFTEFQTVLGRCFTFNNPGALSLNGETSPEQVNKVLGIGRDSGLTLVLDYGHETKNENLLRDWDLRHVPFWIHRQDEMPDLSEEASLHLELEIGYETEVTLVAKIANTTQDFDTMCEELRGCKLPLDYQSYQLDYFKGKKKYSELNCIVENKILNAQRNCQCEPWYFRLNHSMPLCSPAGTFCFIREYKKKLNDDKCQSQCSYTFYTGWINSKEPLNRKKRNVWFQTEKIKDQNARIYALDSNRSHLYHYIEDPNLVFNNAPMASKFRMDSRERYEERFGIFKFYFHERYVEKVLKDAKITDIGKIANLGGTLGLFTGFSFVSLFEIIYLCIRIFKSIT